MSDKYPSIPSPCYVIEERALEKNLQKISRVKNEAGITILCALKAFSNYSTFSLINNYLDGFTASSLHEGLLSKNEGEQSPHMCCPVYLDREFDEISEMSSHITFNSLTQYEKFKNRVGDNKVAIRLNPEYSEVETDIYNPCSSSSRLGVAKGDLPKEWPEDVTGLHFHMLCENDSYTFERCLNHIETQFDDLLKKVTWVNFGGGHLITKSDYNVDHMVGVLKSFKKKYPQLEVIIEPGSAIAWQTGFLLTTVEDVIEKESLKLFMLDVSVANHMPDCLDMPYQPTIRDAKVYESGEVHKIGGMTCLAGDVIGDYSFDTVPKVGDRVIFEDMIHYTTVKTNTFNGVHLPSIGIIKKEGEFELIRSFGYEDFKSRL